MDSLPHIVALCIFSVAVAQAQFGDLRCVCLCPARVPYPNSTEPPKKIFKTPLSDVAKCKCENVLSSEDQSDNFCQKCSCNWQKRNTTTIKVVVIFIVCMVSLLVMYMVFLLCLDPLLNRRPRSQYEQQQDTVSTSDIFTPRIVDYQTDDTYAALSRQRFGVFSRVKTEMKKVQGEQEKWKDTVHEQRNHIYIKHTMLN